MVTLRKKTKTLDVFSFSERWLMYPLKLKAATKPFIWGGDRLIKSFNKQTADKIIAETWEVSCHEEGLSIIDNGEYKGKSLKEVLDTHKEYLGENANNFEYFPILVKLIDAKENLSIQVHPSDEYALKHELQYGKSEMWYVVDAMEHSFLYCGFNKLYTIDQISEALRNGTILDLLNKIPVKKGDVLYIPAGTVHAICGGLLICEIQQNSSVTYRLYDYNRVDSLNKKRELHIDKALDVINANMICAANETIKPINNNITSLVDCKYFKANEIKVDQSIKIDIDSSSFVTITCVDGNGYIEFNSYKESIKKGDTFYIPACNSTYTLLGRMIIIESRI